MKSLKIVLLAFIFLSLFSCGPDPSGFDELNTGDPLGTSMENLDQFKGSYRDSIKNANEPPFLSQNFELTGFMMIVDASSSYSEYPLGYKNDVIYRFADNDLEYYLGSKFIIEGIKPNGDIYGMHNDEFTQVQSMKEREFYWVKLN